MSVEQLTQGYTVLNDVRSNRKDLALALGRIGRVVVDAERRGESHEAWISLFKIVEEVLEHFRELLILDQLPRKICLTKFAGEKPSRISVGKEMTGWEVGRPTLGEPFYLLLLDGRILQTSRVQELGKDHFRTANSVYKTSILGEALCLTDLLRDLSENSEKPEADLQASFRENSLLKIVK